MRRLLFFVPVLLVGCTPQDRDSAFNQGADLGRKAAGKAVAFAGDAWKAAAERASKLSPESASDALESAKASLEKAKAELKPGERLEAAEAEIARLRAALDMQKLRRELDEKVTRAQQLKENAGKTVDDVRAKLEAADKAYQDLNSKLTEAQRTYEDAASTASRAKEAIEKKLGG
jgi:DNA repair exonuclease SbcCD ATPase subunit